MEHVLLNILMILGICVGNFYKYSLPTLMTGFVVQGHIWFEEFYIQSTRQHLLYFLKRNPQKNTISMKMYRFVDSVVI